MTTIRIRHPKGVLKIELSSVDITSLWLYEKAASELFSIYPETQSFWISSGPEEPEMSKLIPSPNSILSPSHGQLFYLHLRSSSDEKPLKMTMTNPSNSSFDYKISRMDGKIKRQRDDKLCRHGSLGMCEHCQPVEPYDREYLEKQGIKHLSFYSWLKKLKDSNNSAVPASSLLEEPKYTVDVNCPCHAPFPEAICTKCQPSAIILKQQPFRMVDHVEFAHPRLIDDFLAGWRSTGFQRFGWLIGKYDSYTDHVPLGIKSVVEYIYEPAQDGSIDGFQLLENEFDARHESIFQSMGLDVVGMIYTDLIDDNSGTGKVENKRSKETFFISSSEVLFIAHQQALHPFHLPDAPEKKFSSRFVSVVVSGEDNGGIGLKAYQVSESAVKMEEAKLIAATTDPSQMLVRSVDENDKYKNSGPLYVPQVFYKFKNEYGIEIQKAANPLFPVEYLLVTLSEGIPLQSNPIFKSPLSFPGPFLLPNISNLVEYFRDTLHLGPKELASSGILFNANLILFLSQSNLFANEAERLLLCRAISSADLSLLTEFIEKSQSWQRIMLSISEAVAMKMNNDSPAQIWTCKHCTFVNEGSNTEACDMCGLPQ